MRTATATSLRVTGKPRSAARRRGRRAGASSTRGCSARCRSSVDGADRRAAPKAARDRLVALARLPGPARRRDAEPPHDAAARARSCSRATASVLAEGAADREAGPRSSPLGEAAAAVSAKSARSRLAPRSRSKRKACPPTRSSAQAAWSRRSTRGCAARPAASCWPGSACSRSAAPHAAHARAHERLAGRAARGRAARSAASSAGSSRCSPRPGRSWRSPGIGLDSAAAAGLDVQDGHADRRARARTSPRRRPVTLRDLRDARRRQAEQRQRRGMRRLARTRVRRLVQLGVRAARRQARRAAARRDGRTLRLQPRAGHRGRGRKHAAGGVEHPGRTGRRLDGDRPGPGAGERAADGDRRGDDRRRRPPAAPTFTPRPRAPAAARDERRRSRARCAA